MELVRADKMKRAFQSMFNLYAHELSEYNPWISTQINENGDFLTDSVKSYIESGDFESYCITENKIPVGMVVFSSELDNGEWFHDVEEIFLINTSRHKRIAEDICIDFWNRNHGTGTLHVLPDNKKATRFWNRLLSECGYEYKQSNENGMEVFRFHL